ncbi:four helix bundle protein [Galbibacter orientalis]|uniref:four helix bundle protein n=1 Tax=Galbibacter orientalis TaxID=453852 RepID=UPI00307FD645
MKTYRELIVWQKSMELVTKSYKIFTDFPKEEVFSLTSQLKRSIVSVPSNIAEGYGRDSKKEYVRFLYIAISSLFEYQTQIEIAYNLEFYTKEKFNNLFEDSREIERMLSSLIRKLK